MTQAPWHKRPLAVLDTETTGLNPTGGDRIVEIGLVLFDEGEVSGRWGRLLDPEMPLPADTTRITGIEAADLVGAPTFAQVADEFLGLLEGRILVAYNVAFDRPFLIHELAACDRDLPEDSEWLDPFVLASELQRGQGNMKLGTVAKRLGVPLEEAHRAVSDAECAGRVLLGLAGDLPTDFDELLDKQEGWMAAQEAQRDRWRSRANRGGGLKLATEGPKDALGPGYPHGRELDPIRYMFLRGTGRF
ncbi:MAG TPA: 3'-5' exonuclease [Myxococcales bacterium]|nr:DNA polymerase III subunit epsilon [Myxococcales bacterium]HAN31237.1 3'-5' exonuclease [Myxococcales bacterium]